MFVRRLIATEGVHFFFHNLRMSAHYLNRMFCLKQKNAHFDHFHLMKSLAYDEWLDLQLFHRTHPFEREQMNRFLFQVQLLRFQILVHLFKNSIYSGISFDCSSQSKEFPGFHKTNDRFFICSHFLPPSLDCFTSSFVRFW